MKRTKQRSHQLIAITSFSSGCLAGNDTSVLLDPDITEELICGADIDKNDFLGLAMSLSEWGDGDDFVSFLVRIIFPCLVRRSMIKKYVQMGDEVSDAEGGASGVYAIDLVSDTDFAFGFVTYLGNYHKWSDKYKHRNDPGHECHNQKSGAYTKNEGRKKYQDGLNEEGVRLYKRVVGLFKKAREEDEWDDLRDKFQEKVMEGGYIKDKPIAKTSAAGGGERAAKEIVFEDMPNIGIYGGFESSFNEMPPLPSPRGGGDEYEYDGTLPPNRDDDGGGSEFDDDHSGVVMR